MNTKSAKLLIYDEGGLIEMNFNVGSFNLNTDLNMSMTFEMSGTLINQKNKQSWRKRYELLKKS